MKRLLYFFALTSAVASCGGQTQNLAEFLQTAGIPKEPFSKTELAHDINGVFQQDSALIYAAYLPVSDDNQLVGQPQLLRFDSKTGKLIRKEIDCENEQKLGFCGSPLGIQPFSGYLVFEFHYNPSLGALLVTDQNLNPVKRLLGFGAEEIEPGVILYTEGMVHFAPVHDERLRVVDLRAAVATEIFPIDKDPLEREFIALHEKLIPKSCHELSENDLCDADSFDVGAGLVASDRKGSIAVLASRSADHVLVKGKFPQTVLSRSAIYVYANTKDGWKYCEQKIAEDEADAMSKKGQAGLDTLSRCKPNRPVKPDLSTADLSFSEF